MGNSRDPEDNDPFEGFSGDYVPQALPKEPIPDEVRMCLVCAYEKPWGVWDSKTGATVCKECRDKARDSVLPRRIVLTREATEFIAQSLYTIADRNEHVYSGFCQYKDIPDHIKDTWRRKASDMIDVIIPMLEIQG